MLSRVLDPSSKENGQGQSVWIEISLGVRGFKDMKEERKNQ